MSPAQKRQAPDIDSVAVIGGGPCGLAAARYLLAEKKFSKVKVFEQHNTVGGVWAFTADADTTGPWVSPVYDLLETNIPHTLMNYTDLNFPENTALFPHHEVVKRYLEVYAEPLSNVISLSTRVVSVRKIEREGRDVWEVQARLIKSEEPSTSYFDAIVVANGHYSDTFIPSISGLDGFVKTYPGLVSHSKKYRRPEQFKNKKVIVVGNSASGIDISAQIATTAKLPVMVSEKERPKPTSEEPVPSWASMVPEIVEFVPKDRSVRFANGATETHIDAVVFCTGYVYSFPFLEDLPSPVVTDGACVHNLYQHVFYINDPTLAFLGIPQRIVPFPFAEGQAAWVSRVWAGRLTLPPSSEMRDWEAALAKSKGSAAVHTMGPLEDAEYINKMHQLSLDSETDETLENGGLGKIPPFWDDEKRWLRLQLPLVKAASRRMGNKRHKLKDLAALGFVYPGVGGQSGS
ncbi:Flavin monooxygenase FMO [Cordyceps fumosorosea ARSEF 2679]|uniref:Flavin monooxygenase FMO n=1 Tax=Cordyceps fumosorosea (strain ARSEF 2679) TaxID=1081104 RepID=A0A167LQZ5_CORFA|nr:Flavin monooxygenase FMO [Cordyceps fumosorosea ARSEF 2679]OAA53392.1 Flavin monooxygenase FMO [Cordyceps fumosorosea ARSEF 2679]